MKSSVKPNSLLKLSLILLMYLVSTSLQSQQLSLHPLFTDHMVLQQQEQVAVWGNAPAGAGITLSTSWGAMVNTEVSPSGKWKLLLPTPLAGGPHEITVKSGSTQVRIADVMVGEVWLASGQSNMEMPLSGFPPNEPIDNAEQEIADAKYPAIRMFTVRRHLATAPQTTIEGSWEVCTPDAAPAYSATAYFFARKLHQDLGIPVGIIHSSWGGTAAEAWTSEPALEAFPELKKSLADFDRAKAQAWLDQFETIPRPNSVEELQELDMDDALIVDPNFDDQDWARVNLPSTDCALSSFVPEAQHSQRLNGTFWYRKKIRLTNTGTDYLLKTGAIDDADVTYFNGQVIGATWNWQQERVYRIPSALVREGENTLAIKHFDGGGGCYVAGPLYLETTAGKQISLDGEWSALFYADLQSSSLLHYGRAGQKKLPQRPLLAAGNPNDLPTSLFNGMIHPLIPFGIKGAIWYQGESNVGRAKQYERLFPGMIEDWRERWGTDFPFYFVQIAPFNYGGGPAAPALRDAQRRSLQLDNTGMVVTLDIGNAHSIHPGNKQDVGQRLALLALAHDYQQEVTPSGPLYLSHSVQANTITVNFDFAASGLSLKSTTGFEIAGEDQVFVDAKVQVKGSQLLISAPGISHPVHVRYAWKDDAEATLFNREGLPASSFSTAPQ